MAKTSRPAGRKPSAPPKPSIASAKRDAMRQARRLSRGKKPK